VLWGYPAGDADLRAAHGAMVKNDPVLFALPIAAVLIVLNTICEVAPSDGSLRAMRHSDAVGRNGPLVSILAVSRKSEAYRY
jgi:hypothetical protein